MDNGSCEYPAPASAPVTAKQSRRSLLALLLLGLSGVVFRIFGISFAFLKPVQPPGSYGGLVDAGTIGDLPETGGEPLQVPSGRFWLVHDEPGILALHSSCTHLSCLFGWDREKSVFVCPCHGSEFSRDGTVLQGPAERNLDRFPIHLRTADEKLLRSTPGRTGAPVPVVDLLQPLNKPGENEDEPAAPPTIFVQVDTSARITGSTVLT